MVEVIYSSNRNLIQALKEVSPSSLCFMDKVQVSFYYYYYYYFACVYVLAAQL